MISMNKAENVSKLLFPFIISFPYIFITLFSNSPKNKKKKGVVSFGFPFTEL